MLKGKDIQLGELRKDYFTNRIVLTSSEKNELPKLRKEDKHIAKKKSIEPKCSLCPGNEKKTKPADMVLVQKEGALIKMSDEEDDPVKGWIIRVIPSNKPAVTPTPEPAYSDRPLYSEPSHGHHYIMITSPNHYEDFTKMSIEQLINVLTSMQDKVRGLYSQKKVSYVAVVMNMGKEASAKYDHPHLEIITLPCLPPIIEQEALAAQKSMNELGICPMCAVINVEVGGPRQILATENFAAIAPWASSQSYEFWIIPKTHKTSFLKSTQKEISDLALILRCTLGGMSKALDTPPFNLVFHLSSEKKTTRQLHWHIEVYPQKSRLGGLEKGMGVYFNQIKPEQVAGELGEYSRYELAKIIGIK